MPEMRDVDITPEQLAEVLRILADYVPGYEVWAFGSRVTGHAKPWSDLDLAVAGPAPIHWNELGKLTEAFQASELPFRVDVMDWNTAYPAFQEVIEEDYRIIQYAGADAARA